MGEGGLHRGLATRRAYAAAGVDVAAGERAVELMRGVVASTGRAEVLGGIGGFAAATRLPSGLADPVLVSATDGVGTKTAIASAVGRFDTIGIDLVAMCADDVVCAGAEPLLFLDYVAVGRLIPEQVAELVGSVAAGCRIAGCALVGGETAEHPGLMPEDAFDLAGFCVGVVERERIIEPSRVREGDAIVGIASSGLHANGFSLVRSLLVEHDVDVSEPYQARLLRTLGEADAGRAIAAEPEHALATVGEVLLTPTRIYARAVLAVRAVLEAGGLDLHGAAHVTGGGLPGNLPRMAPAELGIRVDPGRWRLPSIFRLVAALGGLDDEELRATLNAGIGMALAVPRDGAEAAIGSLAADGFPAGIIGDVVRVDALGGSRYAEEAVPWLA